MKQFLSSEQTATYATARVIILPIPYEATTSYRQGCKHGATAILEASDQLEAYDTELQQVSCQLSSIYTHEYIADSRQRKVTAEQMLEVTTNTVTGLINDNKFVIALGGEHSITTGIVKAYQEKYQEPFTVVQIDAHGDLRYEYEGSMHSHACVMRRIWEMGLPSLPIGIRSVCQEEANLIKKEQIPVFWGHEIANNPDWITKALATIKTKKVFLTIDLDGLDCTVIPGVGTPQPGGLSWYELTNFIRSLFNTHQVLGCDVMELAPITDSVVSEFTAAKLVYKLIGYHSIYTSSK